MLTYQIAELGALLFDYILFRKPDTYNLVKKLYSQLRKLDPKVKKNPPFVIQYWEKSLAKEFTKVKATVMQDVEWLVERY